MACLEFDMDEPGGQLQILEPIAAVLRKMREEMTDGSYLFGKEDLPFMDVANKLSLSLPFAQHLAGNKIEVTSGGSTPASKINQLMVKAMHEKGLDMAFRKPKSIKETAIKDQPDIIITMGCKEECAFMPGVKIENWDLPDPSDKSMDFMRNIRDEIEKKVVRLIKDF